MSVFSGSCIQIHSKGSCLREHLFCLLLNFLSTSSKILYIFRTALRTSLRIRNSFPAIMTNQPIIAQMIRITDVTIFTFHNITAFTARHKSRITPSVQKQNSLPFIKKIILNSVKQSLAKNRFISVLKLAPHINNINLRKAFINPIVYRNKVKPV